MSHKNGKQFFFLQMTQKLFFLTSTSLKKAIKKTMFKFSRHKLLLSKRADGGPKVQIVFIFPLKCIWTNNSFCKMADHMNHSF